MASQFCLIDEKVSQKWDILGAMYKHGSNPETLKQVLPNVDLKYIKSITTSFRRRAEKRIEESRALNKADDAPIEVWNDFIKNCHKVEGTSNEKLLLKGRKRKREDPNPSNDYSFLLSKAMMYAAYFEDHYQSSNPDEPNYNEIYRYLSQILAGEEPTQMRPGNASKVLEMVGRLKQILNNKDSIQRYLRYYREDHSVSYLKPGNDPFLVAAEKRTAFPQQFAESTEKLKEFLDTNQKADSAYTNINTSDSRFIYKREEAIHKLSLKQRSLASALVNIPGLNPLELAPEALVKPPDSIVAPKKSGKKKKEKATSTEDEQE